jgi:hypothetical protein
MRLAISYPHSWYKKQIRMNVVLEGVKNFKSLEEASTWWLNRGQSNDTTLSQF